MRPNCSVAIVISTMFRHVRKANAYVNFTRFSSTALHPKNSTNNYEKNIVQSRVFNVEMPRMFLDEYIWKNLDKWHNKTAMVCGETGRSYLYSELYQKSNAVASFLQNRVAGLREKDVIAVVLSNIPEYSIITLGIIQAGFVVTTINPNYTSDEIATQLKGSDAKFIFTMNNLWPQVQQALQKIKSTAATAIVKHKQNESIPNGTINFDEMVDKKNGYITPRTRYVNDVSLILYSSGTTGLPKGVQLTHNSIVSNLFQSNTLPFKLLRETEGEFQEVIPLVLPMFHSFGMIVIMLNALSAGCKIVTLPRFSPQPFIEVLEKYRPTFAHLVPPLVLFLINHERVLPKHISQLGRIFCSAAPIGGDDVVRLKEKSKTDTTFLQGYGLTEASPITHLQALYADNGIKSKSAGLAVANTEFLILPSDSNHRIGLGPYETGEIFIRGPQVMKGYYKNIEATEATIDKNGWLRTGDIAHYDDDGHIFITDRLKELIKVKGFQVAPAELEEVLRNHPDVEDAAVVGVPHEEYGEVPKAFIVTRKNTRADLTNIQNYVACKVTSYKHLKGGIVVLDSIPKTASGKILRRDLRDVH